MQVINLTPHDIYIIDGTIGASSPCRPPGSPERRAVRPAEPLVIDGWTSPSSSWSSGLPSACPPQIRCRVCRLDDHGTGRGAGGPYDRRPLHPGRHPVRDANGQIIGVHALAKAGA